MSPQDSPRGPPKEKEPDFPTPAREEQGHVVKSAKSARGGVISGRVLTVLVVSLVLAVVMSIIVLGYFRSTP